MAPRTDTFTPHPEKITTAPGQAYGAVTAQRQAQRILPIAPAPAPSPPTTQPGAPAVPTAPQEVGPPAPLPGQLGALDRPTERPNEPLTHGLSSGPGGGPESLTGFGAVGRQARVDQTGTLKGMLQNLAAQPMASTVVRTLAANA